MIKLISICPVIYRKDLIKKKKLYYLETINDIDLYCYYSDINTLKTTITDKKELIKNRTDFTAVIGYKGKYYDVFNSISSIYRNTDKLNAQTIENYLLTRI